MFGKTFAARSRAESVDESIQPTFRVVHLLCPPLFHSDSGQIPKDHPAVIRTASQGSRVCLADHIFMTFKSINLAISSDAQSKDTDILVC